MKSELRDNLGFEADVRSVAEAIWGVKPGECQPEHYTSNRTISELDGLIRSQTSTHLIMATVSTKLEKVKGDVAKLNEAAKIEGSPERPAVQWLITKYQLDAQHVQYARVRNVVTLTLDQFRRRFFDGSQYLSKRKNASFGSARNLRDGTISIPDDEYVELPLFICEATGRCPSFDQIRTSGLSIEDLAGRIDSGEVIVMTAPFGSGKSLTVREIFFRLRRRAVRQQTMRVPVVINLREHWAQEYGDEILERHARSIGFEPRESLTVAWRSGMANLLVDGFDEVASQIVARSDQTEFLRDVRRRALAGVRDLLGKLPADSGCLIVGRDHYFDNGEEMVASLGLAGRTLRLVQIGEFTEDQAVKFLKKNGVVSPLPDWLPRKPLLLGYLAHKGLLDRALAIDPALEFGATWDEFLQLVCERESTVEQASMDPGTVRRVLERLALFVRTTVSGSGPITGRELADAYRQETGQVAVEGVLMQLQRLPGLTEKGAEEGARTFIDQDMLSSLQGGAIARMVLGELRDVEANWLAGLDWQAVSTAAYLLRVAGASAGTVVTMLASRTDAAWRNEQFRADCVQIAIALAASTGSIHFAGHSVADSCLDVIDLDDVEISGLVLHRCIISEVRLNLGAATSAVQFRDCLISRVCGVSSVSALPASMFDNCEIAEVDDMSTNTAVVHSGLSARLKALVTVLRKLYLQAGGGRKMSALKRGVPNGPILDAVDEVVGVLASEGVVTVSGPVVRPVRRQSGRVHKIMSAPALSDDPIVLRLSGSAR